MKCMLLRLVETRKAELANLLECRYQLKTKKPLEVVKDTMSLTGATGPGEKVSKNYLKE